MKRYVILFLLIYFSVFNSLAFAQEKEAEKWWGATPPSSFMIYILNPEALAGWPAKLYPYEVSFIPDKYLQLPVLGSWYDGGGIPDREMLIKLKIKHAFMITALARYEERFPELKKFGMEVYTLQGVTLNDYIVMLRELGKKLGAEERGEELARYAEDALKRVKQQTNLLEGEKKPTVYLAERRDGLSTSCSSEVLDIAGGVNAFKCSESVSKGVASINFEQLMELDPDIIVATSPFFADKIRGDKKWKRLRAYREGRIYITPYGPFGWMDKPAVMRFMAVQWLSCTLYPNRCAVDLESETKKFMKLFLHLELTDEQVKEILYKSVAGE